MFKLQSIRSMQTDMKKRMEHEGGFTLVELMVVVAVIAILISFAMPQFMKATQKAQTVKQNADMRTIKNAAQLYYADHNGDFTKKVTVKSLIEEGYLDEGVAKENKLENEYEINTDNSKVGVTVKDSSK